MSSESDVEMQSALPKKPKMKQPKSPSIELLKKNHEPKKITTKDMIKEALNEQKSRKGISLYAIKKYITEKHNVNIDKINYIIKNNIKKGVEDGTIVQTKGAGASGSFRLAPKKKPEPTEKPKKKIPKKTEKTDKTKTVKTKNDGDTKEKVEKKLVKKKTEKKSEKVVKKVAEKKVADKKIMKLKMAQEKPTPAKKRAAMMKRKSVGSIIKPPKMKPKAKA